MLEKLRREKVPGLSKTCVKEMTMRTKRGLLRTVAWLTLLVAIAALPLQTLGQGKEAKTAERDNLIAAAREIMSDARYCALITIDTNGQAQA